MKKVYITAGAIAFVTVLAACGGGGSSVPSGGGPVGPSTPQPSTVPISTASPVPTASPTVGPRSIRFTWSGSAHSTSGHGRVALATIAGVEPIALGAPTNPADPNDPAIRFGETNATVSAVEVDVNGSPVPSASPSYSIANTAIAQVSAVPQASATPMVSVVAQTPGTTTTTVSFPDGTNGSVTTNSYQTVHPSCPVSAYFGRNGYRYDATSHSIVVASAPASADFFFTGQHCDGAFQDVSASYITLHAPYGYQDVGTNTPMASILTTATFIPQGTAEPLTFANFGPLFWVVKTSVPGVYLKVRITGSQCGGGIGGPGCTDGEYDGDALASDTNGNFAY